MTWRAVWTSGPLTLVQHLAVETEDVAKRYAPYDLEERLAPRGIAVLARFPRREWVMERWEKCPEGECSA